MLAGYFDLMMPAKDFVAYPIATYLEEICDGGQVLVFKRTDYETPFLILIISTADDDFKNRPRPILAFYDFSA